MTSTPTHSLRKRLLWFVLVAILLAAVLQAASAYRGALQQADAMFDDHLQQVARSLRSRHSLVPVLIATARDGVADRIAGLDAGADDYVVKPYDTDELLARVRALLRRSAGRAAPAFEHKGVSLNPATREATVHGQPVSLSAREWAVLEPLLARPGVLLSRAQLEEKLFSWKDDVSSNAVEVYIHGVRKKLGNDLIQTVRGLGYLVPKA